MTIKATYKTKETLIIIYRDGKTKGECLEKIKELKIKGKPEIEFNV